MSKARKAAVKFATGQWVELYWRAREEWARRAERRHFEAGLDYFADDRQASCFSARFVDTYRRQDGSLDLLTPLREKSPKNFFNGFDKIEKFKSLPEKLGDDWHEGRLNVANHVLMNEFQLFQSGWYPFGDPPQWHTDPFLNIEAPDSFYGDIDYLNPEEVGDSKVVWEISRMQWVYELGQAYHLTADERYAAHFFDLLNHWNRRNRDYSGMNFCSALEFAFRANSLAWGVYFFRESPSLTEQGARDVYRLLHICGRFLSDHLSRYFAPNTHLLGEAFGLFLLGTLFPEFRNAGRWQKTGRTIFEREIRRQIRRDGLHAEGSMSYHAYCVEFVLCYLLLAERNNLQIAPSCYAFFRIMIDALEYLRLDDGTWPHFGDDDGGRLLFLSRLPSHCYGNILQAAKVALRREMQDVVSFADTFWLLGIDELPKTGEPVKNYRLIHLPKSGIVVGQSHGLQMNLQAGPFGYLDCPHSHADHLHVNMTVGGESLIIDPGTLCYTLNPEWRNHLRSAAAHNGPRLEDAEFFDPNDVFGWQVKPECRVVDCYSGGRAAYTAAVYTLKHPSGLRAEFRRQILDVNEHGWLIRDQISSNEARVPFWTWITPGKIEILEQCFAFLGQERQLRLHLGSAPVEAAIADTFYSPDYNRRDDARALTLRLPKATTHSLGLVFEAQPTTSLAPHCEVESREFGLMQRPTDALLLNIFRPMSKPYEGLYTDAEFGLIVRSTEGAIYAMLSGVSRLVRDGLTVFETPFAIPFADIVISEDTVALRVPPGVTPRPAASLKYEVVEMKPLA